MRMRIKNSRQGASLVVVLALLAVTSAIVLQLLSASLRVRRQFNRELQREQTRWLKRAADDLAQSAPQMLKERSGQTLTLPLPHFGDALLIFETPEEDQQLVIASQIGDLSKPHELTRLRTYVDPKQLNPQE